MGDTPTIRMVQAMLGCGWGRTVRTPTDSIPCPEQAVQIFVLHDDGREVEVRLCAQHRDVLLEQTTPHVFGGH